MRGIEGNKSPICNGTGEVDQSADTSKMVADQEMPVKPSVADCIEDLKRQDAKIEARYKYRFCRETCDKLDHVFKQGKITAVLYNLLIDELSLEEGLGSAKIEAPDQEMPESKHECPICHSEGNWNCHYCGINRTEYLRSDLAIPRDKVRELVKATEDLLEFTERQCGAIGEICDQCGAMWADDEGGKPEYFVAMNLLIGKEPELFTRVYKLLALFPNGVEEEG